MTFSASTCLSYTGTTTLTEPIRIFTLGGTFITQVNLSQITNCPFVLTGIPVGTTTIRLESQNKYCCNINLTCNDLCTTCNLDFNLYQTTEISRIVAGNLTGSCQSSITDYKINWYRSPDFITPVFTSGQGTLFTPYDHTHPLTGATSPMVLAGTYTPIIDKVKLNGLNYSYTGGSGFIQANLDCFEASTITVEPFTCGNGNGTSDLPNYTHRVQFSGASAGVAPLRLLSTFNLDPTTKYFAWKFEGQGIPDSLKISFNGSSNPNNPIILEWWTIGGQTTTNILPSVLQKSAATSNYLNKITSLMSLSRNVGDILTLEVIPNPTNFQTNWDFYFTCLNTDFSCSLGCLNSYLNSPYKIKLSSVTLTPQSCGRVRASYVISGCTLNQLNSLDITKYMQTSFSDVETNISNLGTDNTSSLKTAGATFTTGNTQCSVALPPSFNTCKPPTTNIIRFQKTTINGVGRINMEFSNLTDLDDYKRDFENAKNFNSGWNSNPTNINYYRYISLLVPSATGSTICGGDAGTTLSYKIHYSSEITTGFTATGYTLTMPMPTITNQMPSFSNCEIGCNEAVNDLVSIVNTDSTGTINNTVGFRTSNTGSRFFSPFGNRGLVSYSSNFPPVYSGISQDSAIINKNLTLTVPFSGNSFPYTPIPSLLSQTCNFSSIGETQFVGTNRESQNIYIYDYITVLTNPPNFTAFTIKANPIVNGRRTSTNYPVTVLTYSNGGVITSNPQYTY
jgi:hypothetical protein